MSAICRLLRQKLPLVSIRALYNNPTPSNSKASFGTATRSVRDATTSIFKETDTNLLVEKFKQSSSSYNFRSSHKVYEYAIHRLTSSNRLDSVEEILEHQKQFREFLTHEGFSLRLISLYGKAAMFENAKKTFDEFAASSKVAPTVKSMNALLSAALNSKKYDQLEELFAELPKKLAVQPNIYSYNILIKSIMDRAGSVDSAFLLIDKMKDAGIEPSYVTFNTLLDGCYKGNRIEDADRVWEEMVKSGFKPDNMSYNALIRGLVSVKKMKEAEKAIEEMKVNGLKPDIDSFNALLRGYCGDDGDVSEAKRIIGLLEKEGCIANKTSYEIIVPKLIEMKDLGTALDLCKECLDKRCSFGVRMLQSLVNSLVEVGKNEEAKDLLNLAWENGYSKSQLKLSGSDD